MTEAVDDIVERIRSEAAISDRPGSYDRLEAIAIDVRHLSRTLLAHMRSRVMELGHSPVCSMHLHERNPYRRCTCWQSDVMRLFDEDAQ